MSSLSLFKFEEKEIRVVVIDGEPWFVAKDVCEILELSDVSTACKRLKDYEKLIQTLLVSGQNRDVMVISESGLYRLILTSRKPQAEPFQDWVCQQVIPSIRKTGGYNSVQLDVSSLKNLMQETIRGELAPIQQELAELRMISHAVNQSSGIQKQVGAQANDDFANYQMLTFNDVVNTFRPYFKDVPKILSRARHSVGKVFATEQERELGKISGKYIFSGWEIQTAINCLDRAAKEVFVEYYDTTLPLMDLIEKMNKENKVK